MKLKALPRRRKALETVTVETLDQLLEEETAPRGNPFADLVPSR